MSPPELKLDITATFDRPIDGRIEVNENWGVGLDTTLRFTAESWQPYRHLFR